jgi:anti-sigma-K factor RskA
MNRDSCHVMEELLVDFADDTLAGEEATQVREHLKQCPQCREMVEALRQSLKVAQTIWQDNTRHGGRARALPSHRWHYVAVAAVIALAAGAAFFWSARHKPTANAPTLAEIENRMTESARAARLLVTVDQLESQPSLRDVAESQYHYIVQKYPETAAAKAAQLKLESLR